MASLREILAQRPPKTITVIRTDRVGDLILSTPFLQGLRAGFPQASVVALLPPYCRQVLQWSGLVDRQIGLDAAELPDSDLVVALAPRTECLRLAYRTGAPVRLGYVYRDRPLVRLAARFLLTHYEEVTVKPPLEVAHEVEHLDRLARRLGLPSTRDLPLTVGLNSRKVPGRLVFHLGDRWLAAGWRFEDVRDVLRELRRFGEIKVTAGPREEELLLENELGIDGIELCRGLSFDRWAELVGSAEVVVSPDTGAVHLSAAMRTPVVVAYEAATFQHCSRQWAPWKVPSRSVIKTSPRETLPKLLAAVEELVSDSRNGAP
jgi:heptosyltransferase-3